MNRRRWLALPTLVLASAALGWGAHGHRTITYLALDALPADAPAWLREPSIRHQVAEQSNEPDRWRGSPVPALAHENNPDHYLDVELLDQFGLGLRTVPRLRYDFVKAMAQAKVTHPDRIEPYDRAKDPDGSGEWPGFLLHAISEHYGKLQSSFNTLRILEALDDPARAHQLALARANVIYHMGVLSHFVADAAQPLHTTRHHHGWVGDNPNGYTTDRRFHAYIDTDIIVFHGLGYDALRRQPLPALSADPKDPWDGLLEHLSRSFALVEPLYAMEKDGRLRGADGKRLISERLLDAAGMLAALYRAAWESSAPTEREISAFVRYNAFDSAALPGAPAAGRSPAATPPGNPPGP
jgi:hypothetical protein